jgi:hypothetical protein
MMACKPTPIRGTHEVTSPEKILGDLRAGGPLERIELSLAGLLLND